MQWLQKLLRRFSTYIFLFAAIVLGTVLFYDPVPEDMLQTKEITIQQLKRETAGIGKHSRHRESFYVTTPDGEILELRCLGTTYTALRNTLQSGDEVTVKYYEKESIRYQDGMQIVVEMMRDGEVVMPYVDDQTTSQIVLAAFGLVVAAFGVWMLRRELNIEKTQKRVAKGSGKKRRKKK